jgi:hypothetical protein
MRWFGALVARVRAGKKTKRSDESGGYHERDGM